MIEKINEDKQDEPYTAVFLENEYLKIMVLPEIGGRVHMALDKTNGHHFIYYNRVIKPALVGLLGPWIAGGIEFNWPQHHRPTTFSPVEWRIDENIEGSKTVWCTEFEKMSRTKGMHGITLHPGKAVLEVKAQIYNRTSEAQTFLWWANVAVHAGDHTEFVFPPDVFTVMDHGKREVTNYPIATGSYYKVDYSPGTDISKFKNLPVPTSYMAYHSDFDFLGCYDTERQVGMLHIADHHIVPGKKLWTWGNGSFGEAWTAELTDEDGPYVELMCGAYTDNQPDFSWLMPGEEKTFSQYFYPFKTIHAPQNANSEAAVHLGFGDEEVEIGVYVTSKKVVRIELKTSHGIIVDQSASLSPETVFQEKVALEFGLEPHDYTLSVYADGNLLIEYSPQPVSNPIVKPKEPIPAPGDIQSLEDLYLSGLHIEQYRHAIYKPEDYYLEALVRDPTDYRNNNAMGLLMYRRGSFRDAERYFIAALESITKHNPNPYDGEAFYNLGLTFKMLGRYQEAYDMFYKSIWSAAWQEAGYFELAKLACRRSDLTTALEFTRRSLRKNYLHHKARHLRIAILRRLGQTDAAMREASLALELDRMEYGAMWERYLLVQDGGFSEYTKDNPNILVEIALDYIQSGFFMEALALFRRIQNVDPMTSYFLGWCLQQMGDNEDAMKCYQEAASTSPDFCFPNQIECVLAIQTAIALNPEDGYGYYFLGNFCYANGNFREAIVSWEKAKQLGIQIPELFRNLAIAYFNHLSLREDALDLFERSFELNPGDSRLLFELDQLYKNLNYTPQGRLLRLEAYSTLVHTRDDLTLEMVRLLNRTGKYDQALQTLLAHRFHPWEGGEGKVPEQYVLCLVELAIKAITDQEYNQAINLLQRATQYPENFGEGKLIGKRENKIYYYLGIAFENKGQIEQAEENWKIAEVGEVDFIMPRYYNDHSPEEIYYQGMAKIKLGDRSGAEALFSEMLKYGERLRTEKYKTDFFAVSVPNFSPFVVDYNLKQKVHCDFMAGLGNQGLGKIDEAMMYYEKILQEDVSYSGASIHLRELR